MPEESKSWPFSSYDFFGYLMPGLIFSLSLYGWLIYAKFEFVKKIHYSRIKGLDIGDSIIVFFVAVVICYFLGHLIGAISHILYDRMLIRNCIGYPFPYLFKSGNPPTPLSRGIYFVLFVCLGLVLIIPGCLELFFVYWRWEHAIFWGSSDTIDWKLAETYVAYFAIFVLSVLCLIFVLLIDIKMRCVEPAGNSRMKRLRSFLLRIEPLLKDIFFMPFRRLTATDSFVSDYIVEKFRTNMKKEYKIPLENQNSDVFWLATMSLSHCPTIESKLNNWLNLYGCLRNYGCSFLLLSIIIVSNHWYQIFVTQQVTGLKGSRILLLSIIVTIVLFLRYWIIYYSYYSKYIIRAYAYSMQDDDENKKNGDSIQEKIISSARFHL